MQDFNVWVTDDELTSARLEAVRLKQNDAS
jgi:hypothetical protein